MKLFLAVFQVMLIAAFTIFYVRMALGRGAAKATAHVWRDLPRRPTFRMAVLIWLAVFLFDFAQTGVDQSLTHSLHANFSPLLFQVEGRAVAALQSLLACEPLTVLFSLAYLILFPALLFGSAHAYDRLNDMPRLRMTAYVYALNYVLCLPFYLYFPVDEPWSFSPSRALPLMDSLWRHLGIGPKLLEILRPMSGIDNCFPSYHSSLTVSLVLIAWSGAPRRFRTAATVSGAVIILSTLYLGFHWMLDMTSGILAGWFVYHLSRWLVLADVPVPVPVTDGASGRR